MFTITPKLFDDEQVFPGVLLFAFVEPVNELFNRNSQSEIVSVEYRTYIPTPVIEYRVFWVLHYAIKTAEGNIVNFNVSLYRIFNNVQNEWRFNIDVVNTNKVAYSTFPKEPMDFAIFKARMMNSVRFLLDFALRS